MPPLTRGILVGAASLGAAFGLLWLLDRGIFQHRGEGEPRPETLSLEHRPRVDLGQTPVSTALNEEMALVTERVMAGVVSIQVQRSRMVMEKVSRGGQIREEEREVPEPGVGSGAIISREGHIVTNWHVVEGGEKTILVTLSGEESARPGKLIDKDEQRDIALLKIESHPGEVFTALRLGDSGKLRVGHMVMAMGSPFGLRETVTRGIISNCARRVSDTYTSYLQTDCVINPGNSGGPLVNLQGDIVGIVTRKLQGPDDQASAEGYGLAIPSNDLVLVLDSLMSKGRPQPYVGVTLENWPERYWVNARKEPEAAIVKGVTRDSPSEKAGLHLGDIVESVDGERIGNIYDFWRRVRLRKAGDTLNLTIRRAKEARKLKVILADLPESSAKPAKIRGLTVRQLRPFERNLLDLEDPTGLHVEATDPSSPLTPLLPRGTNVLHVADPDRVIVTVVATPEEFRKALDLRAATGGWIVTAATGEENQWVKFPPLP